MIPAALLEDESKQLKRKRAKKRKIIPKPSKPLPMDIIEEILLRLPARTVLKFRSACKTFDHITTMPHFISDHTQRCRRGGITNSLVVHCKNENIYILKPQPHIYKNTRILSYNELPLHLKKHEHSSTMLMLDGLLCFCTYERDMRSPYNVTKTVFTLFNPLTRRHSSFSFSHKIHKISEAEVVAIYYHATSDKYKVLIKIYDNYSDENSHAVVTLCPHNALTTIESSYHFIVDRHTRGAPVLIQGNLYGFGNQTGDLDEVDAIVVFNTESEQFNHHIPLPVDFEDISLGGQAHIVEIGGKLCICNIDKEETSRKLRGNLWVLCDELEGIWIEKQVVNVDPLNNRGRTCNVIACDILTAKSKNIVLVILVNSCNIDDIVSPEKEFTFYYLKHDIFKKHSRRYCIGTVITGYKESLALLCSDGIESSSKEHVAAQKRFRTKFTPEQKDKMLAFAERIGWRIQKQDEGLVEQFCTEAGVTRQVLKVWMHNNKHTVRR